MEPEDHPDVPEIQQISQALVRAIKHARPSHPGIVLVALVRATMDIVMAFPPDQREAVVAGVARLLTDVIAGAAHYFPEEFGKQPTKQ
jgi:hypothetical protein